MRSRRFCGGVMARAISITAAITVVESANASSLLGPQVASSAPPIDQIANVIAMIKRSPDSRRLIVTADDFGLAPEVNDRRRVGVAEAVVREQDATLLGHEYAPVGREAHGGREAAQAGAQRDRVPILAECAWKLATLGRLHFAKDHFSRANRKVVHSSSSSKKRMNAVCDERFCDAFENSWPTAEKGYT